MSVERGSQQRRGEKINTSEENPESAITTVKIYGERVFIEINISGRGVVDQEEIQGLSAGQVSVDVLQEAAKRSVEGQTGEKLKEEMSNLDQALSEIKSPTQAIIPPELTKEFLEQILEPAAQSELLIPVSKKEIERLISIIELHFLSEREIHENIKNFSKFKKEIIDRLLELLDDGTNLEDSLKSIISEGISTLENIENIISKIKDNKLDEAIRLLITTISSAIQKKNITFNQVYYNSFVRPTVAATCDAIVRTLRNDYIFREKQGDISNSNIEKMLSIINKIKENPKNNNGGNN